MSSRVILFLLLWAPTLFAQQQIAYLSNQSGNFDLFLIDENGKNAQQLTQNPGWDWYPKWSPQLEAILYNSNDTANQFRIQAIQLNGKPLDIDTKGLEEFILAPDGSKALYTLRDLDNQYIGMMDLTSGKNKLIISHPSYNGRPSWSPNGQQFSFITDRDGNQELYLYQLSKQKSIRLSNTPKREKYTSWAPDGESIFYTYHYSDERDKEHNDIFRINIRTQKVQQITNDLVFYQEICVSPDGKKIAFHAKRAGKHHIYTISSAGGDERQITTADAYHGEPEWIGN